MNFDLGIQNVCTSITEYMDKGNKSGGNYSTKYYVKAKDFENISGQYSIFYEGSMSPIYMEEQRGSNILYIMPFRSEY